MKIEIELIGSTDDINLLRIVQAINEVLDQNTGDDLEDYRIKLLGTDVELVSFVGEEESNVTGSTIEGKQA